jgi:hypothetical protein
MTMASAAPTHSDVVHFFGPIADHLAREILDLDPTVLDLEVAAAYVAGMTDVLGEERLPLSGRPARIFEIVSRDEVLPDEDDRR